MNFLQSVSVLEGLKNNGFATIDYIVVVAYLALLIFLGFFLSRSKNGKEKDSKDYFLAGNTLTWWAVGASLIAANISAEQFIGMSGTAFASGIAIAAYELMAAATLIVVGKFLLPVMIEKKIFTIPQFLRDRYNPGTGLAFSIFWLFLYVFINLTSVAWLGALAIEQILGLRGCVLVIGSAQISIRLVIILILYIIAGVYSIYGGLSSVAWTDVMQVTFLVGGGLITAYAALSVISDSLNLEGGAFAALGKVYESLKQVPGDTHFNLAVQRNTALYGNITDDPYFTLPGIALIVGALWLTNLGYWGFNQYIIQKGLAAKSLDEAKKGMIFAAFLKILIPFIVCIPGVCAFYIKTQQPEMFASLAGGISISDDAYPFLIRNFTPVFVKGLSFAALAAAVISSLASMFNSTSTIFTMDIYKQYINKNASEKKLVNVGRITSVCALVIAMIAVYPIMGGADQAFQIIQEYSGFVYPGVVVIFGLGLLWKRASGPAAVVAAIGTFFFSILFKFIMPNVPFLLRMGYVFLVLVAIFVPMSLLNKNGRIEAEKLDQHTIDTQLKWSKILFIAAGVSFAVFIWGMCSPVLRSWGFEAMLFFAAILGVLGLYLRSNAKDKYQNAKAVGIDLVLFRTDRTFNIGAICVIVILAVLYIFLW
ncbi:MAG: sodium/solute symporter [Bacteroidetes bacterium]|nr:sodium/solute symporter [Candidatus Colenecus caballi]